MFDVYGRHPKTKAGDYFRITSAGWVPIHDLIALLCPDLLDERTLHDMGVNAAVGPKSQVICTEMADRIESWLVLHPGGHSSCHKFLVDEELQIIEGDKVPDSPVMIRRSYSHLSAEEFRPWIKFLRNCGGFKVC